MEEKGGKTSGKRVSASFKVGAIALAFLIIGYQTALLVHSAAVTHIISNRDNPDTVFVLDEGLARRIMEDSAESIAPAENASIIINKEAERDPLTESVREKVLPKEVESFPFNPNTVNLKDLQRLGFSEKQARSIINYREKGGKFRRPSDFAKSFVVADSVYERLEPFIRIPKVDINSADSADFDSLPGIGAYFAGRMMEYREKLHGYSFPEQLMDIHNFDREKFDGLKDLITVGECTPYPIWTLSEDELKDHPYIGTYAAHGIIVFRQNNPREKLTIENLARAGVLRPDSADKLAKCRIADP